MDRDRADQLILFEKRHSEIRPHSFLFIGFRHNAFRIGEHVGNMNQPFFKSYPTQCALSPWPDRRASYISLQCGGNVIRHDGPKDLAIKSKHRAILRLAEANAVVKNRLKDRLKIGWRAGDHPQDFARRGLLLQSFGQITVTFLRFVEQPNVLDRDDRLIRKRF